MDGRLLSRPHPKKPRPLGLKRGVESFLRDGLLFVPPALNLQEAAPLVVLLHGADGRAEDGVNIWRTQAEEHGMILLAPQAHGRTWDMIGEGFGPDVSQLDRGLAEVFERYQVDPDRLAVGGFSDGASYALSLGIINGLLFTHILAFSPGFIAITGQQDRPQVFISHGTQDRVLPVEHCSEKLVRTLHRAGYDVRYRRFEGEHCIPEKVRREAVTWFLEGK